MRKVEGWVRSLSPTAEFLIVVIGAFFLPTATSLWYSFNVPPEAVPTFTDADLNGLIVEEALILLAIGWFLKVRGFTVPNFGPWPTWRDLGLAQGLAVVAYFAWVGPWELLQSNAAKAAPATGEVSWPAILGASILNPLFEELVLCAYMLPTLAQRSGVGIAVAGSLLVRLSFHTYQGPVGLIAIGLIGLAFSLFYVRTLRLWPVLIVHGLIDFVGLANQ